MDAAGPGEGAGPALVPAQVARPADTAALARVMAAAARHGLTVVPRGHGTAADWGAPPRTVDLLVDTTGLSWIDHNAGDLVVEVGAGTPMRELTAVLAAAGQRLSHDPVRADATVGGLLATGMSGPRRLLTGALRDLVIGMTVVRADGVVARSGGRVVKNVAGYDLAKLHTGALGTLGVIAAVAFRLHPLPPAVRLVGASVADAAEAASALAGLRAGTAVPSAVEIDRPAAGPLRLSVVLEGTEGGMDSRVAQVRRALSGAGGGADGGRTDGGRQDGERPDSGGLDGGGRAGGPGTSGTARTTGAPDGVTVTDTLPDDWGVLPERGTLALVTVPPAEAPVAATELGALAERDFGVAVRVTGSAPRGALFAAFPPGAPPDAVAAVAAQGRSRPGWSVRVLRAEPAVHEAGVDLWGEVPGLPLMRAIKDSFDPGHRLSPGRFAGGI
ncbi:FAD-linked oxidase [Nocardiopsis sp. NRRL B-16309]|nr:FAD-binding oxidoreductase [Nocardiopsis sp. NRRL B-16309]KOX24293.1 FAD-linked oxidase [Nocardiopsis sp. NRRL B-16309]